MDLFNVAFFIINYRYCPEFLFSMHISYNLLYSTEMVPFLVGWLNSLGIEPKNLLVLCSSVWATGRPKWQQNIITFWFCCISVVNSSGVYSAVWTSLTFHLNSHFSFSAVQAKGFPSGIVNPD